METTTESSIVKRAQALEDEKHLQFSTLVERVLQSEDQIVSVSLNKTNARKVQLAFYEWRKRLPEDSELRLKAEQVTLKRRVESLDFKLLRSDVSRSLRTVLQSLPEATADGQA